MSVSYPPCQVIVEPIAPTIPEVKDQVKRPVVLEDRDRLIANIDKSRVRTGNAKADGSGPYSLPDLKRFAKSLGLPTRGLKKDLVNAILTALG